MRFLLKKSGSTFLLLALIALLSAGCASRPHRPDYAGGEGDARPPETGTNIPRRIHEVDPAQPPKRRAEKAKRTKKPKPKKEPKREVDEEVITRGGFR